MEKALPKISLHGYWRSSATWRLRLYFQYREIPYEYVPVNLIKGEQRSDEHAKLNPSKVRPDKLDGCSWYPW